MLKLSVLIITAILSFARAKICHNITIPISLDSRNGVFDIPPLSDQIAVTHFVQNYTRNGHNFSSEALTGYKTETGTYHISATVCVPNKPNANSTAFQFLTHGIGFDKSYWDLPFNNFNYSYTHVAVDTYGYNTIAIDRLGIGASSKPDPLSVVQAPAELYAIYQVTKLLRSGSLPGVSIVKPSKVVHIGHSFGSILSYELAFTYPNITDGLILQGFSIDASFVASTFAAFDVQSASINQPSRFGDVTATNLPAGYLTWSNKGANQFSFLAPPYFDPAILDYAESTKQPFTAGEVLTLAALPGPATKFTGPVLVLTGDEDAIFCGGDCMVGGAGGSIPSQAAAIFPNSRRYETHIQLNTGHAVNVHYNSSGAYRVMNDFLRRQGF